MAGKLQKLYASSPVWFQNLGISLYGAVWRHRRLGGVFRERTAEFTSRERFTADEWRDYQTAELRKLLGHAARHVPYYRDVLPADRLSRFELEELVDLPLLEKDAIRREPERFVSEVVPPRKLHAYHTSGTTGTPLAVRFTNRTHQTVSASYEARVRLWAGVNHRMSRAMFGGRIIVPEADAPPPYWRHNRAERQLYMSAFHVSPDRAADYVAALNRFRPDYLVGYASSHYFLARMIVEQELEVWSPRAVLTSSEKLTGEMRATLEQAYRCRVHDGYGGLESCCLASECEHGEMHVSPDVGIIELLDEEGREVPDGQPGEIVATGLLNPDQPLIRYRTGDVAVRAARSCGCGREMPLLEELVGRLEDTVIAPDGREMVRFHGMFLDVPTIREGQVVQESLEHIRLRLVLDSGFGDAERELLHARIRERLGDVRMTIEPVERIERTERGKFRAVISKVPRGSSRAAV